MYARRRLAPVPVVVLAAFVILSSASTRVEYGVGFSLASSYGTSSIYFRNGTITDVAKVESGLQYQNYMSKMLSGSPTDPPAAPCSLPEWLCRFWPAPPSNPLSPMIHALKADTEAFLEHGLNIAEVAIPLVPYPHENVTLNIAAALRNASLQSYRSPQRNGEVAARLLPLRDNCSYYGDPLIEDDPPQVVLTVEYTQASLTAVLWEDDCQLFTDMRQLYSEDIGAARLRDCRDSTVQTNDQCNRELHSALQEVTKLPATCADSSYDRIDWVMIFGEASDDTNLNQVLRDILKEGQNIRVFTRRDSSPQTFAASSGVAKFSWEILDYNDDSDDAKRDL